MEPAIVIAAFVAVGVVVILATIFQARAERERTAALGALASSMGWGFAPEKDRSAHRRYDRFELFRRGHSRSAFNTMSGTIGGFAGETDDGPRAPFRLGDYRYSITRSTGKSTSTRTYMVSYLVVDLPFPGVPDVTIRPEGMFDALASALGFDDIDFEDAEFSRMFHVKSADRRFAYDLCDPRMIEWLKSSGRKTSWVIADGSICLWSEGKRWDVRQLEEAPERVRGFFEQWPSHVVRELASRGTTRGAVHG